MDTCEEGADRPQYVPILYRDGLLIALLIACPMRIKNLANLIIGQHLVLDGCAYGLKAQGRGDQDRQALRACVPNELTGYIDEWLWFHRPALQLMAAAGASVGSAAGRLWIDRWGQPMSIKAIQRQIWLRTRQAFGKGICPHLFRDIAVTELVDVAPEEIGIAADLLGHADLRTTRRYYIQATGIKAHVRVQEVIAARRRAAASR
jgi:integrase